MKFARVPLFLLIPLLLLSFAACSNPERKKEKHYEKALEYIKQKENGAAVIELRNAIQIDPKFANARYQLGLLYLEQNDPKNAFAELQRTASLDPANLDAGVKVAEFLLLSGKKDESRKYVDQVLKQKPDYPDALALLANIELIAGNFKAAEDAVVKVGKKEQETDRFYNIRGRIYAAQEKWPEARSMFEKAIEAGPDNFANYRTLLAFFEQQKMTADAEKLLATMQQKFPDNAQLHLMMASMHQMKKESDKAEAELKKAIALEPDNARYKLLLVDFYKSQNKPEAAVETLRAAMKDKPDAIEFQAALAKLLFDMRQYDEAKTLMDGMLAKNPDHGEAKLLKARFQLKDGKKREAVDTLTPLTTNYPKWAEPYFFLAVAHLELGEGELAQKAIDSALQYGPGISQYHALASQLALIKGESQTAGREASIALKLEPRNFNAAKLLVKALIQDEKFKEAVSLIETIQKQVPNDVDLMGNLGIAYLGLKDRQKAEEAFARLLEAAPDNSKALALLTALTADKDLTNAVQRVEEQIKKAPKAAGHYMLLGDLQARQKKYAEAQAAFEKAQELAPDNPQPYIVIARLMAAQGKSDQAIAELTELLAKQPDSLPANMGLATLYETQGKYQEAREKYQKVLSVQPNSPAAANNLAWLIASDKDGDLGEALRLAMLAKQAMPDEPHIADTLGFVHLKRGSYPLALSQFQQALDNRPDDPVIAFHLAQAQWGKGDKAEAVVTLKKALESKQEFKERAEAEAMLKSWQSQ